MKQDDLINERKLADAAPLLLDAMKEVTDRLEKILRTCHAANDRQIAEYPTLILARSAIDAASPIKPLNRNDQILID